MLKEKFFFPYFLLLLAFLIFFRTPCFFLEEGYWQIKRDSFYDFSSQNNFIKSIFSPFINFLITSFPLAETSVPPTL